VTKEEQNIQRQIDLVLTDILKDLLRQKRWPFGIPPRGVTNKVAYGNLVNSIKIKNANFDKDMTFMTYDIDAIRSPYPYFNIVDKGRSKGAKQPPIQPILNWINKKGINIRDEKGRFITGSVQNNAKKKLSLAYAISGGIKKKGIKGNNVMVVFDDEIYGNPKFFQLYEELFGIKFTEVIQNVKLD
jgi:hypothetical protein